MRDGKRAEKLSLYEDWHVWGLMRAHPLLAYGNERGTGEIRVQHVTPRPQRVIVSPPVAVTSPTISKVRHHQQWPLLQPAYIIAIA